MTKEAFISFTHQKNLSFDRRRESILLDLELKLNLPEGLEQTIKLLPCYTKKGWLDVQQNKRQNNSDRYFKQRVLEYG